MAESVKKNKEVREAKKKLPAEVVGVLDTSIQKVLEYAQEGRDIFFKDGEDFLELPNQVVEEMNLTSRERYGLAKRITNGEDIITAMEDGARGWTKDYDVRPGSFSDNTEVFGKDNKNFDYYLSTTRKLSNRIAQDWEIDRDPNVHMMQKDSGTLKTVGGEKNPECILIRRKKEIGIERKKKSREKKRALMRQTKEAFVETADRLGVVASIDN